MEAVAEKCERIQQPGHGAVMQVLGDQMRCKVSASETHGAWELFEVITPIAGGAPHHTHDWEESYFMLTGELELEVDGRVQLMTPGSFARIPGEVPHAVVNHGNTPCRYLLWITPAAAGDMFAELHRVGESGPPALEEVMEITHRYGIELVGPR